MAGPYYTNTKVDNVDFIEAADLEAIETGFSNVDSDKANKKLPATANNLAALDSNGDLADSGKAYPTGTVVGTSDAQTLTNKTLDADTNTLSNVEVDNFKATAIVTEAEGLNSSDNDTSLPTTAAVKDYVDNQVGANNELSEILANGNTTGANDLQINNGQALKTNVISETTLGAGVTIDSVLLKDDVVNATDIETGSISANDGTTSATIADSTGVMTIASSVLTTTDINGGTIDGADITVGAGKTLDVSAGTLTLANDQISGDKVEGGTINATTITTLTSTTVNATTVDSTNLEVTNLKAKDGTAAGSIANSTGVTTLNSAVLTTADINGGTIDGASIGGSSAASITGTTITGTSFVSSGDMTFGDNDKAIFGAGSDLQIYHDGSHSIIKDSGSGNLYIGGASSVALTNTAVDEFMLRADQNGTVVLYYDNSAKLATTNTGIDVTGTVTADGLTVSTATGSSSITPTDITIKTETSASDWSTTDEWGRVVFYSDDVSNGGAKAHATIGVSPTASGGGLSNLVFKTSNSTPSLVKRMDINEGGNISFYEDTGTTPKFFWDASAESLGIGTSSPTAQLNISANSPTIRFDDDTTNNALITVNNTVMRIEADPDNSTASSAITFRVDALECMRIDSSGNVGIGTSSPSKELHIKNVGGNAVSDSQVLIEGNTGGYGAGITFQSPLTGGSLAEMARITADGEAAWNTTASTQDAGLRFYTAQDGTTTERMRIDSSGNVGVGTSSPSEKLHILDSGNDDNGIKIQNADTGSSAVANVKVFANAAQGGLAVTSSSFTSGNVIAADCAYLYASSTSSNGLRLNAEAAAPMVFGTNNTERMRIDSGGNLLVGTTDTSPWNNTGNNPGTAILSFGTMGMARYQEQLLLLNRTGNDGTLVSFYQEGVSEGSISVSGSTVSYNGGHLSRWSQLPDDSKDETIVKGTVMTNLDAMCEWSHEAVEAQEAVYDEEGNLVSEAVEAKEAYTEDNEQLNRMKVSDVEGDTNVAGVFVNWDNDDDQFNDMNIAMTGDMVIRIAQGTTVARGDLLMSAGDGTAKPQGDDIVRSKTFAKVTSTHVSHTYDDGSYLVPCVLMAC